VAIAATDVDNQPIGLALAEIRQTLPSADQIFPWQEITAAESLAIQQTQAHKSTHCISSNRWQLFTQCHPTNSEERQ
jgi:hypothetical protein